MTPDDANADALRRWILSVLVFPGDRLTAANAIIRATSRGAITDADCRSLSALVADLCARVDAPADRIASELDRVFGDA